MRILDDKQAYVRSPAVIAQSFSPDQTAAEYIRLFEDLAAGKKDSSAREPEAYDALRAARDR